MAAMTQTGAMARARRRARWARRELRRRLIAPVSGLRSSTRRAALVGRPDQWGVQRRFQFDFLTSRGLRPEHRLIDIGCGTLRGGIPLIEYLDAGNYTGVDVRAEVVHEARKELRRSGLEGKRPELVHAEDPSEIRPAAPFDYAWAFMVLIHMPDDVLDRYMSFISRHLADTGHFYANVAVGERPDGEWQGFPVVFRPREFYERAAAAHGLRVEDLGELESLGPEIGRGGTTVMLRVTRAPA